MSERVLVADDEAISRDYLGDALAVLGFDVRCVPDGEAAAQALAEREFDVVVTDLRMPGRDGAAVLRIAKQQDPDRPVVLVTAHGTLHVALDLLRAGADDILEKPLTVEELELSLTRVREAGRLRRENRFHRGRSVGDAADTVAVSRAMRDVLAMVDRVATSDATVLVLGESGTGKERVAAEIHRRSGRAEGPFVKINAAAVPEGLVESEFFGHEAGAFTGAASRRRGVFELASGGTLFLDEIGDMPPPLQAKLLRAIQDGEICRVGGSRAIHVDVRLVVATHRDLAQDVRDGRFREDLYYRLAVVPLTVPPLRARRDDVLPLAERFVARGVRIAADARAVLESHDWPGNVRELQNVVQRASLLCEGGEIGAALLRQWIRSGPVTPQSADPSAGDPIESLVGRSLDEVERALIHRTLARCDGNRTRAARVLGIGVRTLFNKLRT
ncbi:MAG: sigma-54-dependent Fis family transcriptional regulator [Planctomycetes bacterium]|nr:sigma-54-dependent Fis family transcriptional regulator [Planctomycetota bacterium]